MKGKIALKNVLCELFNQIIVITRGLIVPKLIIESYGSSVNGLVSSITKFLALIIIFDGGFNAVIKSQLYKPIVDNNKELLQKILFSAHKLFC